MCVPVRSELYESFIRIATPEQLERFESDKRAAEIVARRAVAQVEHGLDRVDRADDEVVG